MQIEMWPLERLQEYENNPRKNDHVVEKFAEAIREFGFRVPVIARSDGQVVDGHLRLKAARAVGLAEVPVVLADDLSAAQVKAFRISINRMAELAEWDDELLARELAALKDLDIDLELTGLEDEYIKDLLQAIEPTEGLTDEDDVPEPPAVPTTAKGDLWLLGHHRLLCGDATDKKNMTRLMSADASRGGAAMVFTDPPYNVNYTAKAGSIKNDNLSGREFPRFLCQVFKRLFAALDDGGAIYVCHADAGEVGVAFRSAFLEAGFKLASCLIWIKNRFVISRADYHWRHEPILYGWKPTAAHRFYGGRKQSTMVDLEEAGAVVRVADDEWQLFSGDAVYLLSGEDITVRQLETSTIMVPSPQKNPLHPTMKPVALCRRFIENSSKSGQIVLDAFGGSGSTLIACEKTGRICRLMELDERYADVIVQRWQDFTGREATLDGDGRAFAEIKAVRNASVVA